MDIKLQERDLFVGNIIYTRVYEYPRKIEHLVKSKEIYAIIFRKLEENPDCCDICAVSSHLYGLRKKYKNARVLYTSVL